MSYIKNEILYNELKISDSNIVRIIYLSTFLCFSYNSSAVIEKDRDKYTALFYSNKENDLNKIMSKKDVQKVLGLKNTTFKSFFKEMSENNIILEHESGIYINNAYFKKGGMNSNIFKNKKDYTRLFVEPIRIMYEGCQKVSEHRKLSKAFQLVPLTNKETNRICYNPSEMNICNITCMNISGIANQLKVSTDRSNLNKLEKELLSIKIVKDGYVYPLIAKFQESTIDCTVTYYVVNPNICWRGSSIKTLSTLLKQGIFKESVKEV